MQGAPCLISWEWAIPDKLQTEGVWICILLWTPLTPSPSSSPPEFFRFVNLLLANKLLRQRILQNCVTLLQSFHQIFLAKFPDSPRLFGTQVPWLSLTLARNELQSWIIFPKSKSKEFKGDSRGKFTEFQGDFTHDVCWS